MTANWIDWRQEHISVPSQQRCLCAECKKDGRSWTPKTEKSARDIGFIDSTVADYLNDYFGNGVMTVKENYSKTEIWRIIKRCARRVDEKRDNELETKDPLNVRAYPHSIRAAFATLYAEKGVSEQALMDTMGWKDISVAKRYIDSTGRAGKQASQKIRESGNDFIRNY
jgi:integrase